VLSPKWQWAADWCRASTPVATVVAGPHHFDVTRSCRLDPAIDSKRVRV
jgi:hypothetical protein